LPFFHAPESFFKKKLSLGKTAGDFSGSDISRELSFD